MKKEHFEILLEDIKGKLDLVLEGHQLLDKKIEDTRQTLDQKIEDTKMEIKLEIKEIRSEVKEIRSELLDTKQFLISYLNKVDTVLNEHEQKFKALGV